MGERININNVTDDDKQENYGWQRATLSGVENKHELSGM